MKSFIIIVSFIILASGNYLTAQNYHELNINVTDIRNQRYKPAYEHIFNGRFGLGLISTINLQDDVLRNTPEPIPFSASRFEPTFIGRYYLNHKKRKGYGLFVGPYLSFEILLNRDENYETIWLETVKDIVDDPRFGIPTDIRKTSGLLTVIPGINYGYKFLIKEHFTIELFFFMTFKTFNEDVELLKTGGFDNDLDFKIGYRF